jgi:hypothetical protein
MPTPPARSTIWLNSFFSMNVSAASWASLRAFFRASSFVAFGPPGPGLRVVGVVGGVHLGERDLFGGEVLRADDGRPFERHVLEHVRQTGDPGNLLRGPDVDVGEKREDGRHRPAVDEHGQPVLQLVNRQVLFECGHVLCFRRQHDRGQQQHHGEQG